MAAFVAQVSEVWPWNVWPSWPWEQVWRDPHRATTRGIPAHTWCCLWQILELGYRKYWQVLSINKLANEW